MSAPDAILPSCALDRDGLRGQADRYRRAGRGARILDRSARSLQVELREEVEVGLVDELVAVERACCPFFTLSWRGEQRLLSVSVSRVEDEPSLAAIASALGLKDAR